MRVHLRRVLTYILAALVLAFISLEVLQKVYTVEHEPHQHGMLPRHFHQFGKDHSDSGNPVGGGNVDRGNSNLDARGAVGDEGDEDEETLQWKRGHSNKFENKHGNRSSTKVEVIDITALQNQRLRKLLLSEVNSDPREFLPLKSQSFDIHERALRESALFSGPTHSNRSLLYPSKNDPWNDRIVAQMKYIPEGYSAIGKPKLIVAPAGVGETPKGKEKFRIEQCPVRNCILEDNSYDKDKADAILYQNEYFYDALPKSPDQIWILWLLESPMHTGNLNPLNNKLNWTATYRSDSTIVTPYEKFVHFSNFTQLPNVPLKNYAKSKTKMVAWFVSNCGARNNRMELVHELQKYIDVDIYGACGPKKCYRSDENKCFKMLSKEYRFYLSFENSNCKHYITEKYYLNGLQSDIVPVVLGGRKRDYEATSPPHSFIHVEDFSSVRHLAGYLMALSQDDELYNQYLLWKGTGEFINTKFWCRLCAMLHDDGSDTVRWYRDVDKWWRSNHTCTKNKWNNPHDMITNWKDIAW